MTANRIIELMNARPFRPFEIHLADGERIAVQSPHEIATRRNSPFAVVYDSDDTTHLISYRNITQVVMSMNEPAPPP